MQSQKTCYIRGYVKGNEVFLLTSGQLECFFMMVKLWLTVGSEALHYAITSYDMLIEFEGFNIFLLKIDSKQ